MRLQLKNSEWLVLIVSCWIQVLNASLYLFSSYSQVMKTSMNLDQKTLTTIASFISVGSGPLGILSGYLYTALPHWLLISAGILIESFSFLMVWLTISHRIHGGAWLLCIYHLLIGYSQTLIQTTVVVTNITNFPSSNGAVAGLLKGFQVLGTSILIQVFYLVCGSDQIKLPWMVSWLVPFIALGMFVLRSFAATPHRTRDSNFYIMGGILAGLGLYLLLVNILEIFLAFGQSTYTVVCMIILVFLLLLLTTTCRRELVMSEEECLISSNTSQEVGLSVPQTLQSLNFWLLFLVLVLGFGSSAVVSSNLAQLADSLGYTNKIGLVCVSLFSICSCWGRAGAGILADFCLRTYALPKSVFLVLAMLLISAGMALAAIPIPGALFALTVLSGLCDGTLWCLCIAVASDLFGLKSLSIVFNILYVANTIGTYLLSSRLVGYMYDIAAGRDLLCQGGRCFRGGLVVLSALGSFGACLAGILVRRSSK